MPRSYQQRGPEGKVESTPFALRLRRRLRPVRNLKGARRAQQAMTVVWVLVRASSAAAQGAPDEEPVEVTIRGSTATAYVSSVSAEDTPRAPLEAASLLEQAPGVHVRRLGADGSLGAMSIRGSASTQVAVFLGGVPLTSAGDPAADVGSLPLWPGARFRVYRGFVPASLGATGYLGGAVVLEPPAPLERSRTETWLLAGSFGTLKVRAGDLRRVSDVSLGTAVYGSRTDGAFTYEEADPVTGAVRERERENARSVAAGALSRAELSRPWGAVGATALVEARRQGVAGMASRPSRFARIEGTRVVLAVDGRVRASERSAVRGAVWARRETQAFDDPRGELSAYGASSSAAYAIEALGSGVGWRVLPADRALLDVFVDGRAERFVPAQGSAAASSPGGASGTSGARRIAGGLGAELDVRVAAPLTLAASARLDARRDEADGAAGIGGARLGAADELAPSGHGGAMLRVADELTLSAHAGALRRPPSFLELYGDSGALKGNPALRPERALSADAGAHGTWAIDAATSLSYEAVGFASWATDLIAFLQRGLASFEAQNVDRALIAGAELSLSLSTSRLRTTVGYTLLVTTNLGDDPLARGRPLPGRPAHDLGYDAAYRFGPARVHYALDAIAGTTADARGTIVLPPRILHGAGASLDVPGAEGLRVALEATNLLDVRTMYVRSLRGPAALPVSDFLGFPLPGRALWVTVGYAAP